MTRLDDIKPKALGDGISPDFSLISRHFKKCSEELFYHNYLSFKSQNIFAKGKTIIKKYKLEKNQSDLLYFLVEAYFSYKKHAWAKDVSKAKEDRKAFRQIKELNKFCNAIQTFGGYKKSEIIKEPIIQKIIFKTDKNKFEVDSHKLCVQIIDLIQNHYFNNRANINVKLSGIENINSAQYTKKFIMSLKPLINYLNNETIEWGTKNKIYKFVCDFIGVLDIVFIPEEIKDALKPSRH